jgi:predicted alpha/beta-fold hydrolase
MPVIPSRFVPPFWLRNGHAQTILGAILPRRLNIPWVRERLELEDGDFLDLDWWRQPSNGRRLAILCHGLEGSSRGGYIEGTASVLHARGWDVLAWNFRGCSGEPNREPRSYHSGETGDLARVIRHAKAEGPLALIGYSLGGNVTVKYLGEGSSDPRIVAAVAVSVPLDLASCAAALDQRPGNRLYLRRFLRSMTAKAEAKIRLFPGKVPPISLAARRSIVAFDDAITAPLHGFRDAADYYAKCSGRFFLDGIRVPTLILSARDDPFLAEAAFPEGEAEKSAWLHMEAPERGGHVGFLDFARGVAPWSERRVADFLDRHVST